MSDKRKHAKRIGLRFGIASFVALLASVFIFFALLNASADAALVFGAVSVLVALALGIAGIVADFKAPESETVVPMFAVFVNVIFIAVCLWILNDFINLGGMH